jgi:hypothetical protein
VSGQGRKPNRGGARRPQGGSRSQAPKPKSQGTPRNGAGTPGRAPKPPADAAPAPEQSAGTRPANQTQPIPGARTRRQPADAGPAPRRSSSASARSARARQERNRKILVVTGAGVLVVGVAGALIGGLAGGSPSSQNATATGAGASGAAATRIVAGPSRTGTPSASASATGPVMAITCPQNSGASPLFGHEITAATPYKIAITYGDGDSYTDTDAKLGAIFSHTYPKHGSFPVTAVLTDSAGKKVSASCTYTWP